MKNILNIEVNTTCVCNCYENLVTGQDEIVLRFERDNPTNSKVNVMHLDGTDTYDVEFNAEGIGIYKIDLQLFIKNKFIRFQFLDDEYEGSIFTILCDNYVDDVLNKTLVISKKEDFVNTYEAKSVSIVNLANTGVGDGLTVDDDGNLVVEQKTVIGIQVTKTADAISNVTIIYDDSTTSSNDCTYDSTGNLTKFGDLPILWGDS